jgi:fatty acid synthase
VGDPQEMNAVTEVFTKGRKGPLRTGSIKSNMGHGEPASALSAVIKICVAMECGILPPNLHYNIPNPDIPALLDGRLKVCEYDTI